MLFLCLRKLGFGLLRILIMGYGRLWGRCIILVFSVFRLFCYLRYWNILFCRLFCVFLWGKGLLVWEKRLLGSDFWWFVCLEFVLVILVLVRKILCKYQLFLFKDSFRSQYFLIKGYLSISAQLIRLLGIFCKTFLINFRNSYDIKVGNSTYLLRIR